MNRHKYSWEIFLLEYVFTKAPFPQTEVMGYCRRILIYLIKKYKPKLSFGSLTCKTLQHLAKIYL